MRCRNCKNEMNREIIYNLPEPQEFKYTCDCGEEAWKGEFYDLVWIDRQEEE